MPTPPVAWFKSLPDSVYALGAAAREYRFANQAALAACWNADLFRLRPVDGQLSVPGGRRVLPHDDAMSRLADLYLELELATRDRYENTALAYAYGTAMALLAIHGGQRPTHVELDRGANGQYHLPGRLLPDLRDALGNWAGNDQLATLRNSVLSHEQARDFVDDLASSPYLPDHEAAELADASRLATGLANSAYAYGEQAESAMHFLLSKARNDDPTGENDR